MKKIDHVDEETFYSTISDNLNAYLKKKNIKEKEILENIDVFSQSTLNKILHGKTKINLYYLSLICDFLGVSIDNFIDQPTQCDPIFKNNKDKIENKFIYDTDDIKFNNYLGMYYCYFYATTSSENKILEGTLLLDKNPKDNSCDALLDLNTKKGTTKRYEGKLIISNIKPAAYCILYNYEFGEISAFTFRHKTLTTESNKCRIAVAITTSSGKGLDPTMHRMIITSKKLNEYNLELLKTQLLMNNSKIIISKGEFEKIKEKGIIDPLLIEMLEKNISSKEFYVFHESLIKDNEFFEDNSPETLNAIVQLRLFSLQAKDKFKYNKVSGGTDLLLFDLLEDLDKSEELEDKPL